MTSIPQFAATRVRSRQLILVSLDVMATAAARTEDSAAVFESQLKNKERLAPLGWQKTRRRCHDTVIRVYDEGWQCDRDARARCRVQGTVTRKTKSRHAVKRDG